MLVSLHVPLMEELAYRQQMMSDPATMAYNRGYDLSFEGYHRDTGCIDFPRERWAEWYARFVGREPRRYYAYLAREEDGRFVGEVCLHQDRPGEIHEMGIVVEARYRGLGYSREGMDLLLRHAFRVLELPAVSNCFEESRAAALSLHRHAGFRVVGREDCLLRLLLTREEYMKRRP